jgi:hypothetical protein
MANLEPIEIRLSPAVALYREKLLLRKKEDLPAGLIPVPSVRCETKTTKDDPTLQKIFVKGMIQVVASAIVAAKLNDEVQHLALVEFTLGAQQMAFELYCASAALVHGIKQAMRTKALENVSDLTIEYQMAIPPDARVPLVFWYQPKTKRLLVINKHHMNNPEQFLDPQKCRTTSGLLNFIGSLLLLEKFGEASVVSSHLKNFLLRLDGYLDSGLDEWLRWLFFLASSGVIYQASRVLVHPDQSERYYYDTTPK